jgi:hypothetical protein
VENRAHLFPASSTFTRRFSCPFDIKRESLEVGRTTRGAARGKLSGALIRPQLRGTTDDVGAPSCLLAGIAGSAPLASFVIDSCILQATLPPLIHDGSQNTTFICFLLYSRGGMVGKIAS